MQTKSALLCFSTHSVGELVPWVYEHVYWLVHESAIPRDAAGFDCVHVYGVRVGAMRLRAFSGSALPGALPGQPAYSTLQVHVKMWLISTSYLLFRSGRLTSAAAVCEESGI